MATGVSEVKITRDYLYNLSSVLNYILILFIIIVIIIIGDLKDFIKSSPLINYRLFHYNGHNLMNVTHLMLSVNNIVINLFIKCSFI